MNLRLFTAEQASALAPYLEVKMQRVRALRRELQAASTRQEVLDLIADSGAEEGNPDVRAQERLRRRVDKLTRELTSEIESIETRGCLIKDLEKGLVDFYGLMGDRLVFLCWQSGEEQVTFWHPIDEGFASRRRLESEL